MRGALDTLPFDKKDICFPVRICHGGFEWHVQAN